jgi:hypothetical protein
MNLNMEIDFRVVSAIISALASTESSKSRLADAQPGFSVVGKLTQSFNPQRFDCPYYFLNHISQG